MSGYTDEQIEAKIAAIPVKDPQRESLVNQFVESLPEDQREAAYERLQPR